jgi:hypothetical protein
LGVSVPIWEVRENNSAASSCAQPVLLKPSKSRKT